jgi:hypothetical protein
MLTFILSNILVVSFNVLSSGAEFRVYLTNMKTVKSGKRR